MIPGRSYVKSRLADFAFNESFMGDLDMGDSIPNSRQHFLLLQRGYRCLYNRGEDLLSCRENPSFVRALVREP